MIIKPTQFTMADMFKSVGYSTCAIGKWHLGLGAETGNDPLPQLYRISDNLYEQDNVADTHPTVVYELQNILRRIK